MGWELPLSISTGGVAGGVLFVTVVKTFIVVLSCIYSTKNEIHIDDTNPFSFFFVAKVV